MADQQRHGELIYSELGEFCDLENGDNGYHAMTKRMLNIPQNEELSAVGIYDKLAEKEKADKLKGEGEGAVEVGKAKEEVAKAAA